ncbi:MAG: hypothetical protein OEQ74_02735 [Gammaproteobacteria bacterium]|nr:hypothetical protein [Gammaproteobacteria bacterium]
MADFYSPLLAFALTNLIITAAILLAGHLRAGAVPAWVARLAAILVLAAVFLGTISHMTVGYRSGSAADLTAMDFVAAHPAPFIIGFAGLFGLIQGLRS